MARAVDTSVGFTASNQRCAISLNADLYIIYLVAIVFHLSVFYLLAPLRFALHVARHMRESKV